MTDDTDESLDALVTRSLVNRGDLIPTTVDEVLDASAEDVELPASLAGLYDAPAPRARTLEPGPVKGFRPVRVVAYAAVLLASAAAVWAIVVAARRPAEPIRGDAMVPVSAQPALSTSADAHAAPVPVSAPTCDAACCAGAACSAAKGELATCPTARTCTPCTGVADAETRYRVRVGDILLSDPQPALQHLALCIKVGASPGAEWSCEPARAPSSVRPHGRFLATASRAADLTGGVAMELRLEGTVRGRWWSIVEPSPRGLCLGYRVGFQNDRGESVGTLSMVLERTYWVELAQRVDRSELDAVARSFSFDGLAPRFIAAGSRSVLAVGPLDRWEAEQLLDEVTRGTPPALAAGFRIDVGDAYVDAR